VLPLLELVSCMWIYLGKKRFVLSLLGLSKDFILLMLHCLVTSLILLDLLGSIRIYNPTIIYHFCLEVICCTRFY
jgi:hypothetical protein